MTNSHNLWLLPIWISILRWFLNKRKLWPLKRLGRLEFLIRNGGILIQFRQYKMVIASNRAIKLLEFVLRSRFQAIAIFPFIFVREESKTSKVLLNHERIHLRQQLELLIVPSLIWYLIEGVFKDYRQISFEREAFANEKDLNYLKTRKWFAFVKYL